MLRRYRFITTLLLLVVTTSAFAQKNESSVEELSIATAIGSNMVLQQGEPIDIWGEARPGTKIHAQLGGEKRRTEADEQGEWLLTFRAREASFEPLSLKVNHLEFDNILIGEVWLCSGQSNMNFALKNIDTYSSILEQVSNENLRILQHTNIRIVAKSGYTEEELARCNTQDFFQMEWIESEVETAGVTSAVAWLFGNGLQQKLNVPVGVIQVALGGSALNNWIPPSALKVNPLTQSFFEKDWLDNDQIKLAHRNRAREAFKNVLKSDEPYIAGQFPYRWLCEPGFLFEAGIAPLKHLSFRGTLWYQGESDTDNSDMVEAAKELFPMVVDGWRSYFDHGDFPFIYIQLPGFENDLWPEFREVQREAGDELESTAMVVTIDLGAKDNIHPKDKQPIGERAVHKALKYVYGFKELTGSPKVESWILKESEITLNLKECGLGLLSSSDTIYGFEVAGERGEFIEAKAYLSSDSTLTILSSIKEPSCLRYAWVPFPSLPLTLYNSEYLPLAPFRIDLN